MPKNSVAKFFFPLKEGLWETEIKIQVFWSALVLFLTPFCEVYYLVLHPVETANCKLEERRGDVAESRETQAGLDPSLTVRPQALGACVSPPVKWI